MAYGLDIVLANFLVLSWAFFLWHFLKFASTSKSESGTTLRDKIQINVELCKHLDRKLVRTRKHIDHYGEMSDRQKKVLQELDVVMKRADDLLQECMCKKTKSWLFAAVTLTDIKEDVLEIELDLAWWTSMLDISTADLDTAPDFEEDNDVVKALDQLKTYYYKLLNGRKSLQEAASNDKEHLQAKLEKELIKHAQGTEQHLLSVYLLSRLKASGGESNIPVDDIEFLDKHFRSKLKKIKNKGTGAFGTVDEVTWLHQPKHRQWAMKTIFDTIETRPEAKFLRSCSHPHIIRFIWSWEQEDSEKAQTCPHILMELMPMDLSTLIRKQRKQRENEDGPPFEMHVAIDIMLQIAKAMRYLHGKRIDFDGMKCKITHRDLKPGNVLVEQRGTSWNVKLADFGISKVYDGTETMSTQTAKRGTSVYAAPEVFLPGGENKKSKFPPKADVWSFAMTCSEILTGEPPFKPHRGLHDGIKNGIRPDLPTDIPQCLIFCITSCWNINPQQRPNFLNICRMLSLAKATSLGILPLGPWTRPLLEPGNPIRKTSAVQITSEPHPGQEVGERYFLVGTIFKNYVEKSMKEVIIGQSTSHRTGIQAADKKIKCLNPIQKPIMQGSFWAISANWCGYGCLFGVFVSSKYEAELRQMDLEVVTGGYMGESEDGGPEVGKYVWGENTCDGGSPAAEYYSMGKSSLRYVYVYVSYGLSKRAVISHCWQDDELVLGDRNTASSASAHRIVLGSKILTDYNRSREHLNFSLALASP